MNIGILEAYDFHDSLVEKISFDEKQRCVELEIDFCNWKQSWYNEEEPETEIKRLVFENVTKVILPQTDLNSDEIICLELIFGPLQGVQGVRIIVLNDLKNEIQEIEIYSTEVTFV